MAPGDVCHGPRCSLAGLGPAALGYRPCCWPGRSAGLPKCAQPMGCWFYPVPRPPYVCTCVRCPGPLGSWSPVCPLGALLCLCSVLGHLAPARRCARWMRCFACAVSWATWHLFTGVPGCCVVLLVRCPGPVGSCSPVCLLGAFSCLCGVLGHLAPVHRCARSACFVACAVSWATWLLFTGVHAWCVACVCGVLGHLASVHRCARWVRCFACTVSWATWLLFTGVSGLCVVLLVRCPGPVGSCSPLCPLDALFCLCGVLGHLAPVHRCARSACFVACAVSWVTWLLFTGVHAWCVAFHFAPVHRCARSVCCLCVRCPGHLAPVHRCARSVCCVACAVSLATWLLFTGVHAWCVACVCGVLATWLLFTGVPARRVLLCVQCPGPLGSCSPVCTLGVLPVCAVSWATWPLFTGVPAGCVVLLVRCPGQLGSCSPVCLICALFCLCGVLGQLAPVHRCAHLVHCFACAVSWATWLLFTGVPVRPVLLRVQCPRQLGSCSPVCTLGALLFTLLLFTGVPARCVACLSGVLATWLLFTAVPARCAVLRVRCPWPLGSCSPVCTLGVLPLCAVSWPLGSCSPVCPLGACAVSLATWLLFTGVHAWCVACVCGVLGNLAPVHRCTRSVCCFACAVSWATCILFAGVPDRCAALLVRCPGPLGVCSPVCPLGVLFCLCGVLGPLAPVHCCARSVCCAACAVSWATWLLFAAVSARCAALRVRCPGPLGSCSPVCPLAVLFCLCGVLGHWALVHGCARSVCCLRVRCPGPLGSCPPVCPLAALPVCAVSWATWLLFTGVPDWCVFLLVWCPGPLGSCSPVCPLGVLCCVCGVLGHFAPVHRCARSVCCVACVVSWAPQLLFTGDLAQCAVRCPGPLGPCSLVCWLGVSCCGLRLRSVAAGCSLVHPDGGSS